MFMTSLQNYADVQSAQDNKHMTRHTTHMLITILAFGLVCLSVCLSHSSIVVNE